MASNETLIAQAKELAAGLEKEIVTEDLNNAQLVKLVKDLKAEKAAAGTDGTGDAGTDGTGDAGTDGTGDAGTGDAGTGDAGTDGTGDAGTPPEETKPKGKQKRVILQCVYGDKKPGEPADLDADQADELIANGWATLPKKDK